GGAEVLTVPENDHDTIARIGLVLGEFLSVVVVIDVGCAPVVHLAGDGVKGPELVHGAHLPHTHRPTAPAPITASPATTSPTTTPSPTVRTRRTRGAVRIGVWVTAVWRTVGLQW